MSIWTSGCTPYQLVGDDEPAVASVAAPPEAPDDRYRATGVLEPRVPAGEGRVCGDTKGAIATPVDPSVDPESGVMRVHKDDQWMSLPLARVDFDARVVGTIAETSVTQEFHNPYDEVIEAVYVFPMPEGGAVDDYWFHVGDRHIHGLMKPRAGARALYEAAREEGRSAALLEQERPNIFTQSVANIPPGATVQVEMHVVTPVLQEAGRYTLSLPTVVGPRYIPGAPTGARAGLGAAPDTDQVADASRITPPILGDGSQSCAALEIAVEIDAGIPITGLATEYHRVATAQAGDRTHVELARRGELPNRDFVLSWTLAGQEPQASMMAEAIGDEGYVTVTIEPPKAPLAPERTRPRELVFVVDTSGSMHGVPLETAKATIGEALDRMRPSDTFQIIRFSDTASPLGRAPLANTAKNRAFARDYLAQLDGGGGTNMLDGILAALTMPQHGKAAQAPMRMVLFLTDGYIGNEHEIFEAVDQRVGETRLFSLGVGSSVNRYLLDGLARVGRGAVTYMGPEEPPKEVVGRFYDRIDSPVLTDISLDFGALGITDLYPAKIPDLFHGQPVTVVGRFKSKGGIPAGDATLKGKLGGAPFSMPVALEPAHTREAHGIASVWARQRIDALLGLPNREDAQTEALVTELALQHRIMTKYTSFVAVEERQIVNPDGTYETVVQPVDLPPAVDARTALGPQSAAKSTLHARFANPSPKQRSHGTGRGGGGVAEGTIGLGNVGIIGKGGGSGAGAGYGRGAGEAHGGRVPRVRAQKPEVAGAIDKDIIRRIVRAHIAEVRKCYEAELAKDPSLEVKLAISFVIDPTGAVREVKLDHRDAALPSFEQCLTAAFRRWRFPKPEGGGVVTVSYPFHFQPE